MGGQFVGNRWNTEATYGGSLEERNVRYRSYRVSANLQWSFDDNHSIFAGAVVMILPENLKLNHPLLTQIVMWKMAVFLRLVINTNSRHLLNYQ